MFRCYKNMIGFMVLLACTSLFWADVKVLPLDGVNRPYDITVGHNRAYVTETTTVHAFSLSSLKKIKSFGKGGEGPREFKGMIFKIDILPTTIVVNSTGRLSHFTPDGDFIKQQDSRSNNFNYKAVGDKYVGMKLRVIDRSLHFAINLYDPDLKLIKELYLFKHPWQRKGFIDPTDVRKSSYRVYQDRIYIDHADGTIWVYSIKGEPIRQIKFPIIRQKIGKKQQERYMNFWKTTRLMAGEYKRFKDQLRFPAQFAPIRNFLISGGRIYVLTYKEKDLNNELVVLDTSGNELKRIWAPLADVNMLIPQVFNYYTIHKNTLYILAENPDTEKWNLRWVSLAK